MKFDFRLEQTIIHSESSGISELDTTRVLFIERDEILSQYEKDEISFFMTLRELIFLYHKGSGYLTQLTDDTMIEMHSEVLRDPTIKGIGFYLFERESLQTDNEFSQSHSHTIKLKFER